MHLLAGRNIRQVQLWLGHSDLENHVLLPEGHLWEGEGVREAVDNTFAGITVKAMRQQVGATIQ
jgi:hypothetical protein